jgi:hypothetical protein
MAEGLRSIIKRIHWSLLLKTAVFGLSWYFLPAWLFCLIGIYLYFLPIFHWSKFVPPFVALIVLGLLESQSVWFAFVYAGLFLWLFLIRDLLFIDRKPAYEILVIAISFFLTRKIYSILALDRGGALPVFLFMSIIIGWMIGSLAQFYNEDFDVRDSTLRPRIGMWLSSLFLLQIFLAIFYLPLDFIYQSVAAFLFVVLLADIIPLYFAEGFSREKILLSLSVIFSVLILVFASAQWGL